MTKGQEAADRWRLLVASGLPKGGPDASHPTVEGTPEQVQALIQGTVKSTLGALLGGMSSDVTRGIATANGTMGDVQVVAAEVPVLEYEEGLLLT